MEPEIGIAADLRSPGRGLILSHALECRPVAPRNAFGHHAFQAKPADFGEQGRAVADYPFGENEAGSVGSRQHLLQLAEALGERFTHHRAVPDRRDDRVWVYRSRDDGKSWGEPVAMDKRVYRNETALLHMGGGRWLAAIREDGLHLHSSADDGQTWHDRMRLTGPAQHPGHLLRLRSGRILLSHGNRTPNARGVDVRWSDDEGKTWSSPIRVVDFEGDGGYPSSVQLPNGEVVTAYYAREIEGHDRYHRGVVIWDPEQSLP